MLLLVGCKAPSSPTPATDPNSQTYILNNSDNHHMEFIQILPDADRRYTIQDIVQPQLQDRSWHFPTRRSSRRHEAYWGKILLENRLPEGEMHREWVLNFTNTFTRITLYRLAENGTWTSEVNGTLLSLPTQKIYPNKKWHLVQITDPSRGGRDPVLPR